MKGKQVMRGDSPPRLYMLSERETARERERKNKQEEQQKQRERKRESEREIEVCVSRRMHKLFVMRI